MSRHDLAGVVVSVPASSANLGPGFDTLGVALSLRAEVGFVVSPAAPDVLPDRAQVVEPGHPLMVAFGRAGGSGALWARSPIPAGRGLGFSGAMRVAGAVAAHVQRHGPAEPFDRDRLLAVAVELEGHADNAAASMYGGIVAATPDLVIPVPCALTPAVVMWIPFESATSTDHSRRTLPSAVPLADAAFNIGRTAQLVAALAVGNVAALRTATQDRLHQSVRLAAVPDTHHALDAALATPAWAAWLSGSGPSVAVICDPADAAAVAAALPATGHTKVLGIDAHGAVVTQPD